MSRYDNLSVIKTEKNKRYYTAPLYPEIANLDNDDYILAHRETRLDLLAFNYYNDIVIPSNMKIPFLFEYLCPMKDKLEKHLTIFPIYSKFPPKNDESNKENDNKHHEAFFDSLKELKNDENSKLNCYYNNTITYFENLNKV